MLLIVLLFVVSNAANHIQRGIFQFQSIQCCDPVSTRIDFETPMQEIPQIILTTRAIEFESGPIEYFSSLNDISELGFTIELSAPKGTLLLIVLEYVAINSEEVELGFFNIDALGLLHQQSSGDASVPLFMRFRRHFIDEPLVQVFLVGFQADSRAISFEIIPFSVAQNGVTLKVNKYGATMLNRLQLSYVATEQSAELARAVTHTGIKTAAVGYEFMEIERGEAYEAPEPKKGPEPKTPKNKKESGIIPNTTVIAAPVKEEDYKTELVQLAGINGLRFMQPPVSFIWQGDRIEPTALNVNLRITLDKGNQAVLGLYYFESKRFRKCPKIFSECGYQGSFVYICRNVPDFERVFKAAKSVIIPAKSSLIVYQDTSYTGVRTKLTESQQCITDWFTDVPSEQLGNTQTLRQMDRFRKHSQTNDVLFFQRPRARDSQDFWQNEKKVFGVRMPTWYSYDPEDGSMLELEQENGKHFEKIQADGDSMISFEPMLNEGINDMVGYNEENGVLPYLFDYISNSLFQSNIVMKMLRLDKNQLIDWLWGSVIIIYLLLLNLNKMKKKFIQVFLDFQIGTNPIGRVIFELFTDITPKTAENFRGLCTGEYGNVGMGKKTKRLHYMNSSVHRIVDGMCIQGGDITVGDGTGGASIYGGPFVDENFQRRHACAGLLSMANRGRNTNQSQFFITLKPSPHLDGKHVVFGQVIEGMEVIKKIGQTRVDMQDRPVLPITIINCGEVNDMRKHWNYDPFNKEMIDEYRERKWKLLLDESSESESEVQEAEVPDLLPNVELAPEEKEQIKAELKEPKLNSRLAELRERIRHAKVLNDKAVLQEEKFNTETKFTDKKTQSMQSRREKEDYDLEFKSIAKDQSYLNKPCLQRLGYTNDLDEVKHGATRKEFFGWDVFNDDAIYNAYKKRCTNLQKDGGLYNKQMQEVEKKQEGEFEPNNEALERLSSDINRQFIICVFKNFFFFPRIEKRKNFSRRRMYIEDEAVTYINERNRVFNRKLQRNFGAYAADIKANLERGTAH